MVLRLDPTIPSVWRSPTSLQYGVEPPRAVIDDVGTGIERMLHALEVGTTVRALEVLGGVDAATRLLETLGPVVRDARAPARAAATPEIRIRSTSIDAISGRLRAIVPDAAPADRRDATRPGLLVVDHVVAPSEHIAWMREDRPHLAIVLGEDSILVGPLVVPGRTACLRCRDLHRRDADPAWPAIATQLVGRPAAAGEDPLLLAGALALGMSAIVRGAGPGVETGVRVRVDGEHVPEPFAPHPECGCFGIVA